MRDYPGSTGYTLEQLRALGSSDIAVQDEAMKTHGAQLAAFLVHVVKNLGIKPIQLVDGRRTNGLALSTWSMGNMLGMAFLGNAPRLQKETTDFLVRYLRTHVMFDSANSVLGRVPPSEGVYHPLRDMSMTLRERGERFSIWVSAYFEQAPSLDDVTIPVLEARKEDPSKVPTLERMAPEELASITDNGAYERSSHALLKVSREVLHANVLRALVDTDGVWPDVNVLVLWCDASMHDCVWAAKFVANLEREPPEEGKHKRRIDVERLSAANHFVHWDAPEQFMQTLADRLGA
ncbi:hypothetical protein PsYK624_088110 [Phanerochaete sordida]|uniref:Alpha/beta-hydrolase n=1 Tax=Phanerochaete sordida TaxID=48140 RepID=A0A9P3GD96_9APHY|nr:hypothetical protein PsYK624_088110 [Phanerochaete sordida]